MSNSAFQKALQSAQVDYNELVQQRLELETRILKLEQTIRGLTTLCDEEQDPAHASRAVMPFPAAMRLTSATRQVLAESDSGVNPRQLRDALVERGLNLTQYTNPLAVIHNTLIKLHRQGEAMQISGAWVLTDKGRLASKMDLMDLTSPKKIAKSPVNRH